MTLFFNERMRAVFAPPRYIALPFAGIELSASSVKGVRLQKGVGGLTLAACKEIKLPAGSFTDGEIVDRPIVAEAIVAVAGAIDATVAHVALPESKSYLFETTVSGRDASEWQTEVEQHLDEFIPLSRAETVFDIAPIGQNECGEQVVAGIGFASRIVDDTLAIFADAGVRVQSLEGDMFASARAILPCGESATVLCVDIGKTTTKISFIAHGVPRFTTTIDIGGHALTLAVQKYFGVTEDEARKVKIERGLVGAAGNEEYLAAMLSTASAIRDEIGRRLAYWQERAVVGTIHEPVTRVILVGGNASVRGLSEYLEGTLHLPVASGDVFTNLASRDVWIPEIDYTESLAYTIPIGLALRDAIQPYA